MPRRMAALTAATPEFFRKTWMRHSAMRIKVAILDLEQLSYISSAGLRVILMTAKGLERREVKFGICSLSESIQEVFQISGFDKIIPVNSSQAEAIQALAG